MEKTDSDQQEVFKVLPKLHPVYKTYIDLKRCAARLDDYIAQFPESQTNEVDLYLEIYEQILELIEKIPRDHK